MVLPSDVSMPSPWRMNSVVIWAYTALYTISLQSPAPAALLVQLAASGHAFLVHGKPGAAPRPHVSMMGIRRTTHLNSSTC